ncbi:MAG: hypothetical protein RIR70_669 [Pseudomonadota bacterium]|jgi:hypothetical protein
MKTMQQPLSADSQQMLDCLRATAAKTLDRKKRLGHYAVIWAEGRPVMVGEDAPLQILSTESKSR